MACFFEKRRVSPSKYLIACWSIAPGLELGMLIRKRMKRWDEPLEVEWYNSAVTVNVPNVKIEAMLLMLLHRF